MERAAAERRRAVVSAAVGFETEGLGEVGLAEVRATDGDCHDGEVRLRELYACVSMGGRQIQLLREVMTQDASVLGCELNALLPAG